MSARDDAAEVRRALDRIGARALLERLGLAKGAQRLQGGALVLCPAHDERTPSCRVQDKDGGIVWFCHGCHATGDAIDLVAAVRGLSTKGPPFIDALREAAELAGLPRILDGRTVKPRPVRVAPPLPLSPSPTYPDRAEVAALWGACVPVLDVPEAADVLRSRGLSPETVELHDLARALPDGCPLPRWARFAGRTWFETGHRLLLPVFDEGGTMRSLRGWRVLEGHTPKRLPPTGHKAGGLVLANDLGRAMLEAGTWPNGAPLDVVITEGEPDFIARAGWYSDADELAPAVLGIAGSGAWSQAIADRIPDGARVFIRTDLDEAGERYAREVARTIGARCALLRQRKDAPT